MPSDKKTLAYSDSMMGSDCGMDSINKSTGRSWTMTPNVLPLSRLMKLADSRYCLFSDSIRIFYNIDLIIERENKTKKNVIDNSNDYNSL